MLIVAFTLLAQTVLLALSYRAFVRPLVFIVSQIEKIHSLGDRIAAPSSHDDEFSHLTGEINNMLVRMEHLNQEKTDLQLAYYRGQILLLQAQINPHFLYNNLQCIRGMSLTGNSASIREMVTCIANIYRYGSRAWPTAALCEELECVNAYKRIIELRHGSKYTITIECEEKAKQCVVPRMLLQPLVENSIVHGFNEGGFKQGTIRIRASLKSNRLKLEVCDDGIGMDEAQLARVNAIESLNEEGNHHLGIANVFSRMRLIFGEECGLSFEAEPGKGTNVFIWIDQKDEKFDKKIEN